MIMPYRPQMTYRLFRIVTETPGMNYREVGRAVLSFHELRVLRSFTGGIGDITTKPEFSPDEIPPFWLGLYERNIAHNPHIPTASDGGLPTAYTRGEAVGDGRPDQRRYPVIFLEERVSVRTPSSRTFHR